MPPPLLVTFGEALLTYKPAPADASSMPLAGGASLMLQAVGGAELNVAVAFARASSEPGTAEFVSVVPAGPLGEIVVAASAGTATPATVKRVPDADIGTLHVVDDGRGCAPLYQRARSAFCTTVDERSFDWPTRLAGARWFHTTGITPMLGAGPRAAWKAALAAASSGSVGVETIVDLNHRPALGSLEELWGATRGVMGHITCLVLSEDTLLQLAQRECGLPAGAGPATHDAQLRALRALRERLGVPLLACCFKRALEGEGGSPGGGRKNTLFGGAGVRRWSAVAFAGGEAGTADTPTEHAPVQALGGGDAWVAGFLLAMTESGLQPRMGGAAAADTSAMTVALGAACRRGDLLAALQMATHGDLSDVGFAALREAEATYRGRSAALGPGVPGALGAPGAPAARMPPPAPPPAAARLPPAAPPPTTVSRPPPPAALDFGSARIMPVVTITDAADAVPVARALLAGGLDAMELVLRTPAAEEALRAIASEVPEMSVGAGTVLSTAQAERAVAAGASFLVAPGTNARVVRWAQSRGVPIIPGAATATEVEAALELGLTTLKFFPAEAMGGAAMLKALSGPYPAVKWMPTGGVTAANMANYLTLPSVLCVGGTWLVPPTLLERKDYAAVEELARAALEARGR